MNELQRTQKYSYELVSRTTTQQVTEERNARLAEALVLTSALSESQAAKIREAAAKDISIDELKRQ